MTQRSILVVRCVLALINIDRVKRRGAGFFQDDKMHLLPYSTIEFALFGSYNYQHIL